MKALIAEDDVLTLDAIERVLKAEGFETLSARNGREALAQWRAHRPDLICLDIMMPELDGYEVCRQIRREDETIPVLFVSAKSEETDVVVGLGLGADDFVRKPFGRGELMARIRVALRRSGRAKRDAGNLRLNDLVLIPSELRAVRNDRSIELSPREVQILQLLHENAGRPVDRDTLLNRCWGMEYYPESRTLDQHILNLRKRIELDPAEPEIIETVRGVGYRFRPQPDVGRSKPARRSATR